MKKNTIVIDSYALLAFLEHEKGAEKVRDRLAMASRGEVDLAMSMINWGEIYYIVLREYGKDTVGQVVEAIKGMPITVIPADEKITIQAATIKARNPLSYADAFAAALTAQVNGVLLTGDREFKSVEQEITIEWI